MPTYTVHAPPLRKGESAPNPERFRFVRDGFHFWAFLLAPLWLLLHRLWLALLGYIVVNAALGIGLTLLGASNTVKFLTGLVIALLVGLEAATLERWTLTRRGWQMLGFVVGEDREAAEQRFFSAWVKRVNEPPPLPAGTAQTQAAVPVRSAPGPEVIGLFPEPGGSR